MAELPYRQLEVWQRAQLLAEEVLNLAASGQLAREHWFRNQLCSAAMSVSANIAEGNGRSTPLDYASFIDRARGSLFEVDCWLDMARRQRWVSPEDVARIDAHIHAVSGMLLQLARSLRKRQTLPSRDG